MKPNLLKKSSSQTAVLDAPAKAEKQVEQTQSPQKQSKQELKQAQKQLHKQNKQFLFNAFSADLLARQEKSAYISNTLTSPVQPEQQTQNSQQAEVLQESLDKTFVDFKAKPKPQKKQTNFRFRLAMAVYVVILSISVGWVATNAVKISQVQNSIHLSDIKYAQKVKDLEKIKEQQQEQNANLVPWAEIIGVQPLPLEDVTEYEQQSNWFDNIINWFGNLFGG